MPLPNAMWFSHGQMESWMYEISPLKQCKHEQKTTELTLIIISFVWKVIKIYSSRLDQNN
jgi:hypothetical protein